MEIQLLSGIDNDRVYNPAMMREYLPSANNDKELKRAGILIGAKLDMYDIAQNLRWAYLPQGQLIQLGLTVEQVKSLKSELKKAEELYENTGGNRLQFARAILEGLGNQDGKVKIDYKTLGSVAVSFEEQILQASPHTILLALQSQVVGSLGTLDNSAESVSKASDTLLKIGNIAQSIATITTGIAQRTSSTSTTPTADIYDEPQKAGFGAWIGDNKLMAGAGLLFLAGLAVTKMNIPDNERGAAQKKGLSGVKRKRKKAVRTAGKRSVRRKSHDLGIIPLM